MEECYFKMLGEASNFKVTLFQERFQLFCIVHVVSNRSKHHMYFQGAFIKEQ